MKFHFGEFVQFFMAGNQNSEPLSKMPVFGTEIGFKRKTLSGRKIQKCPHCFCAAHVENFLVHNSYFSRSLELHLFPKVKSFFALFQNISIFSLPDWEENEAVRLGPGGSKISLYLDTISTEMKYTTARDRNWACLVSS